MVGFAAAGAASLMHCPALNIDGKRSNRPASEHARSGIIG